MDEILLTTEEVAGLLRVHPKQVYRLLKRGLPGRRVGNEWRFVRDEVLAWSGGPAVAGGAPVAAASADRPPLVAANGDVALEALLDLANAGGPPLVGFVRADREGGLALLRVGAVLAAGCHGAGFPARIGDDRLARIHLVRREIGLAVGAGEVPAMADLHRLRFAGRPATAGVTVHLDEAVQAARARPPKGTKLASHRDVAFAVLSGEADVGVLTAAWAARLGLSFQPFATEAYGLVVRAVDLGHPVVVRLCEVAQGADWRARLTGVAGYDLAEAGAIGTTRPDPGYGSGPDIAQDGLMSDITLAISPPRVRVGRVIGTLLAGLYAGSLASGAVSVFLWGGDYWFLPREARAAHPLDAVLRPGGFVGLWLGVIGLALMVVMLVYTVRKAAPRVRWLGPVPAWLRFHMICGVMGPIYIALHDGLMWPRGMVAIGFWCMVLVALSGVFGRYVYGFFPRTAAGRVEDLDEAREALAVLREDLVQVTAKETGSADAIREAVALARDLDRPARIVGLVGMGLEARRRTRRIRSLLASTDLDPVLRQRVTRDSAGQVRLARSLAAWEVAGRLLRWWHLFHLPLAKAMYAIIAIHLVTVLLFGGVIATLFAWPWGAS